MSTLHDSPHHLVIQFLVLLMDRNQRIPRTTPCSDLSSTKAFEYAPFTDKIWCVIHCNSENKPLCDITWRMFFGRYSNHSSERLSIKLLYLVWPSTSSMISGCLNKICSAGRYQTTCVTASLTFVIILLHILVTFLIACCCFFAGSALQLHWHCFAQPSSLVLFSERKKPLVPFPTLRFSFSCPH